MIRLRRSIHALFVFATLALAGAAPLMAQQPNQPTEIKDSMGKYALSYGLVLLGIVLGVTNIVRPGRRKGDKVHAA